MNRSDDLFTGGPGGLPDNYWQRAFEEASETPPPRVWDAVERQLDLDDEDGIVPLWRHRHGQQAMLFGRWAAGIAATFLLAVFGWWAWHSETALTPAQRVAVAPVPQVSAPTTTGPMSLPDADQTGVGQTNPLAEAPTPVRPVASNVPSRAPLGRPQRATASQQQPAPAALEPTLPATAETPTLAYEAPVAEPAADRQNQPRTAGGLYERSNETRQPAANASSFVLPNSLATNSLVERSAQANVPTNVPGGRAESVVVNAETPSVVAVVPPAVTQPMALNEVAPGGEVAGLAPLHIQPVKAPAIVGNDRIVWFNPSAHLEGHLAGAATDMANVAQRTERRKPWVSAGMMASTFNSSLGLRQSAAPALVNTGNTYAGSVMAQNSAAGTTLLNTQIGSAVAVQAGFGLPLSERWAIEGGVGYLSSQHDVQSPNRLAVSVEKATLSSSSFYADLVSSNLSGNGLPTADPMVNSPANGADAFRFGSSTTRYDPAISQTVSNAYQFVQVPAQVSYEFRPRRKFGLAFLTGIVSNWFVRNTVNERIEVKPGDGLYRPVTVAGTAGMRFRFRPDRHWSASLLGTFQQSLQSLTLNDVNMQALPQQVGISFSVDRHF